MLFTAALGESLTAPAAWSFANGDAPGWVVTIDQMVVVPANLLPVAFVGVAWSLGLEIQLYVVYSFLVRKLREIGVVRIVASMLILALAWRVLSELVTTSLPVGQFFPGGRATTLSRVMYTQLPARAFEWFLGVLAAEAYFGRIKLPRWTRSPMTAVALIAVSAAVFRWPIGATSLNGHFFRVSDVLLDPLVGLAYFVLLQAVITRPEALAGRSLPRILVRALGAVGLFSYSLYLLHPVLLAIAERLLGDISIAGAPGTLLAMASAIAGAALFSRIVERPFITGTGDRWVLDAIGRLRDRHVARRSG